MSEMNPYQAYTEDAILNSGPIGLVVALYEGAIDSCAMARKCLASRDIPGRTKAINRVVNILTELLRTLNDEQGGEISLNLRRLYAYIQSRVTDAHIRQDASPLEEVEKLLSTMLEGWRGARTSYNSAAPAAVTSTAAPVHQVAAFDNEADYTAMVPAYGGYMPETSEYSVSSAYSF